MSQSAGLNEAVPTACPFVALDHDRDARSPVPDVRHRCYAEQEPAQRTFAHQERFCLSPNFAACPIFAEWAVRAAARPAAGTAAVDPAPELWVERIDKSVEPEREERWPDSMAAVHPASAALAAADSPDSQQLAAFGSGSAAPDAVTDEPPLGAGSMLAPPDQVSENRDFDPAPLPTFLSARSPRARSSFPQPETDENLAPVADGRVHRSSSGGRDADDEGAFTRVLTLAAVVIIIALGIATVLIVPGLLSGSPGATGRPSLVAGASRAPTPLASGVAGVSTSSLDGATPVPSSSIPTPAATPTPTPSSYKIQPGDRLRQIAREFGVTVEQILAANPQISDPNDIQVGQRILIPSP